MIKHLTRRVSSKLRQGVGKDEALAGAYLKQAAQVGTKGRAVG